MWTEPAQQAVLQLRFEVNFPQTQRLRALPCWRTSNKVERASGARLLRALGALPLFFGNAPLGALPTATEQRARHQQGVQTLLPHAGARLPPRYVRT
jgi:hypothetical protein